jgi:aminoglycoside 6'-N-acetyltransferase
MISLKYKQLAWKDLPLLHVWYNRAHVLKWYSKQALTFEQLESKYRPYIEGTNGIQGFICSCNNKPFGYIQYYSVKRYPWSGQELHAELKYYGGVDAFIGEKEFLGQGLGKLMIERFVQKYVWKKYLYCLVDPHAKNKKALACYRACGFSFHQEILSDDREPHCLMVKRALLA